MGSAFYSLTPSSLLPACKPLHPSSQTPPSSSPRCPQEGSPAPRSHPQNTQPSTRQSHRPSPAASLHSTNPPAAPPQASSRTQPSTPALAPAFHADTAPHHSPSH